ncbi:MAG: phosphoribosylaminoimidazolesuccinocarboxamide synthase [Proteobacteria bacterium]|nr:phosphoribosylaminoimidazolesuccinocarboxamide synthase [Pseudomonadota bacterium]
MTPIHSPVNLRELYQTLSQSMDERLWKKYTWEGPTQSEVAKWQAQGYGVYQGKIRTILNKDGRIQMLHSDRLTAFDRLISHIPGKGAILTSISRWWFEQLQAEIPTHFISATGSRVLLTEACNPFKVEVVVRGYLAGSMLRAYQAGDRSYCGVKLPDGLKPYERLPEPIITPTTKAAAFEHDENITAEKLIQAGICTHKEWDEIARLAMKVFSIGNRLYAEKGWILADTKYEFGRNLSGTIKLIDEVHTPDCSRLWIKSTYELKLSKGEAPEMLDKENVRRWLLEHHFSGHGDVPTVPKNVLLKLAFSNLEVAEALWGKSIEV